MQGVTTVTSFPSSRRPLMRFVKRILMPLTWLKGLGSTKMATLVSSTGSRSGIALALTASLHCLSKLLLRFTA